MNCWTLCSLVLSVILLSRCNRLPGTVESSILEGRSVESNEIAPDEKLPELSPTAYRTWVNDPANKLSVVKNVSGMIYTVRYDPLDLVALKRFNDHEISADALEAEKRGLGNFQYYTFTIGTASGTDILKHGIAAGPPQESRAQYLSFDMQRDIRLAEGSDTLACAMYQYEQNFGLLPYTNFILAFPRPEPGTARERDKTLVFRDRTFGSGIVTLTLHARDLNRIPTLVINTSQK